MDIPGPLGNICRDPQLESHSRSPVHTHETLLLRRGALLEAQAAIQQELLEVNRLLNSFAPINTLPVELLTEVLHATQASIFASPEPKNGLALTWISISSVCSHWRTIVIQNPIFWRSVAIQHTPELLSLALGRTTRGTPIDVYFESKSFPWSSMGSVFQDRFNDIRALRFGRTDAKFVTTFAEHIDKAPLPALEELSVACEDDNVYPLLPLSRDHFPALQSLSLHGLKPFTTCTFPRLRRLAMHDCGWDGFPAFLNILEECKQLEELDLELSLPALRDISFDRQLRAADGSRRSTVELPQVRTLRLARHHCEENALVLSYLRFPNATDITIIVDISKMWAIIEMFRWDPQRTFPVLTEITAIDIVISGENYKMDMQGPHGVTVQLSLEHGGSFWYEDDSYRLELPVFYTQGAHIISLHLTGCFTDRTEQPDYARSFAWMYIFEEFRWLETLHITGSGLCTSMWEGLSGHPDPRISSDGCYGSSLHSVILDGEEPDDLRHPTFEEMFTSMRGALSVRAQLGLPLRTLTLDPVLSTSPDDLAVHEAALLDALEGSGTNLTFFPRQLAKLGGVLGMASHSSGGAGQA